MFTLEVTITSKDELVLKAMMFQLLQKYDEHSVKDLSLFFSLYEDVIVDKGS